MSNKKRGAERKRKMRREFQRSVRRGDAIRGTVGGLATDKAAEFLGYDATSRPLLDRDKIGPDVASAKHVDLGENSKALLAIEASKSLFDIREVDGLYRMQRAPDRDSVLKLSELMVNLWPRNWEPIPVTAKADEFSLLFWGSHTPSNVVNVLTRASLYADNILVVNPFTDLLLYHPHESPLVRPDAWTAYYALNGMFLAMLEPWVRAGIVRLVQNPAYFNMDLMNRFAEKAIARLAQFNAAERLQTVKDLGIEFEVEMCLQTPPEHREAVLDLMKVTASEKVRVLQQVAEILKSDPIRELIPIPIPAGGGSQLSNFGTGMSYEHALHIASTNGAELFTNNELLAKRLRSEAAGHQPPLQGAANAFSQIKLDFLNGVPTDFAIGLRADAKLKAFRNYLRSLARGIEFGPSSDGEREFIDRLESEYAAYKEEWKDIQRMLGRMSLASGGAAVAAVLTGTLPILGALGTTVLAQAGALTKSVHDRRKLERQPLGVLLKLDRVQN